MLPSFMSAKKQEPWGVVPAPTHLGSFKQTCRSSSRYLVAPGEQQFLALAQHRSALVVSLFKTGNEIARVRGTGGEGGEVGA